MQIKDFQQFYTKFQEADVDEKIELYCTSTNLSENQYISLLKSFPPSEFKKLEKAMHD